MLYRHGESAGSGHYTVDVYSRTEAATQGKFGCTAVGPMRYEDVLREHSTEQAADKSCVYLYFVRYNHSGAD